ncbi:hypothetical protein ACFL03_00880 [Thermodesulfobacteriota bacterium]
MLKQKIKDIIRGFQHRKDYKKWLSSGKPIPAPHIVKQMVVKEYAARYGTPVFIETGTYLGEMVFAVKDVFNKVISIELSTELYEKAVNKFSKYKHISILHGDSSKLLPHILNKIDEPCLFWFDAHYSEGITARGEKETPIKEEINHISKHSVEDPVILIDDARLFTGKNDYPTLEELNDQILSRYHNFIVEVKDDIILAHRK